MFNVLRLIIIIVTALFTFGWTSAAADPAHHDSQKPSLHSDIVLLGVPVRPHRQQRSRYRSPFIVPMTPPDFEPPTTLPTRTTTFAYDRPDASISDVLFDFTSVETLDRDLDVSINLLPDVYASIKVLRRDSPSLLVSNIQLSRDLVNNSESQGTTVSKHVAIAAPNLQALRERVTLHNLSVAAIEDQLRSEETWRLSDLESIANQLQSLDRSRQLWMMYWKLLESKQQWRAGNPETLSKCVELLSQRIFETQVAVGINRFAVTTLSETTAMRRLQEITEQLEDISSPDTPSSRND